jgi:hypothetical protein
MLRREIMIEGVRQLRGRRHGLASRVSLEPLGRGLRAFGARTGTLRRGTEARTRDAP